MNILLTGANGLIGRKIIEYVSGDEDIQIIATSKGDARFEPGRNSTFETFDITDKKRGRELYEKYKPEFIINAAAITQADDCESGHEKCRSVNIDGVKSLLELSSHHNTFFLQLSTDFVFNGKNGPYREEDPPDPVSFYGRSKWEAEKIIMNSKVPHAIARTILVYGYIKYASRKNLVTWVIESLKENKMIKVVADQIRTPTLAEDVASGCLLILKNGREGMFHIGGLDTLSPYDMAIRTAKIFDLDSSFIEKVTTAYFPQPAKRPLITGLIIEKAIRELNYKPHCFDEGLLLIRKQMEK